MIKTEEEAKRKQRRKKKRQNGKGNEHGKKKTDQVKVERKGAVKTNKQTKRDGEIKSKIVRVKERIRKRKRKWK